MHVGSVYTCTCTVYSCTGYTSVYPKKTLFSFISMITLVRLSLEEERDTLYAQCARGRTKIMELQGLFQNAKEGECTVLYIQVHVHVHVFL